MSSIQCPLNTHITRLRLEYKVRLGECTTTIPIGQARSGGDIIRREINNTAPAGASEAVLNSGGGKRVVNGE